MEPKFKVGEIVYLTPDKDTEYEVVEILEHNVYQHKYKLKQEIIIEALEDEIELVKPIKKSKHETFN